MSTDSLKARFLSFMSLKKIFNIFCCPPILSSIAAKLAFIQKISTYSVKLFEVENSTGPVDHHHSSDSSADEIITISPQENLNSASTNVVKDAEKKKLVNDKVTVKLETEYEIKYLADSYPPKTLEGQKCVKLFFLKASRNPPLIQNPCDTSDEYDQESGKKTVSCFSIQEKRGIACAFIKPFPESKIIILYSHGNAVDIGILARHLYEIALCLKCNIVTYDYAGYGMSSGKANEKNVCSDVVTVYNYMITKMNIDPMTIVLYGQSIGSVPTVSLASQIDCAGVIIHSGLASGLRVLFPHMYRNVFLDVFNNYIKIKQVESPTLIIHGTEDEIVHFENGKLLHNNCKNPVEPLFVAQAGHNNIECHGEYILRLMKFLNVDIKQKV